MRFCTYNCRGYNDSKKSYMISLLSRCDFLFLQEHWLSEAQIACLNSVSSDHLATGISGFGNYDVLAGRPYGGCAIFWRKHIDAGITVVDTGSRRMHALRVSNSSNNVNFLLINVYMPYEIAGMNSTRTEEFIALLSSIEYLISQNQDCIAIVGGDFNVELCRNSCHCTLLNNFCMDNDLYPVIRHAASQVDYTYQFNMSRFSVLDHFIIPASLFDNAVHSLLVEHDVDNRSDHEPLILVLHIPVHYTCRNNRVFTTKIAWHKASLEHLTNYRCLLQANLRSVVLPVDTLVCQDVMCCNVEHQSMINKFANDITHACLAAAVDSIPKTNSRQGSGSVPGWTDEVEPVRQTSIFWHNLWVSCGRPHDGVVADIMRKTRATYHYAVRSVKRREQDIVNQRFATALLSHKDRDF